MGRLLRKKTTVVKKKKKADGEDKGPELEKGTNGATDTSAVSSGLKAAVVKKVPQPISSSLAKSKIGAGIKIPYLEKSLQFLREVKVELKKVAWPSRKQTIGSTAVVLVLVFLIAFFLGGVDLLLAGLIKTVL